MKEFRRYAILVAICVLMLIAIGAEITSRAAGPQPDSRALLDANVHRLLALSVGVLVFVLAFWQWRAMADSGLVWAALGLFSMEALVGWLGGAVLHASLAPLVFASLVAVVVVTSPGWSQAPELVSDREAPFLRPLAIAAPPLVLLQTVLGATYRHKLTGLMPHLGGAMLVSLATLVGAMLILRHYPEHRPLRRAAITLMSVVLAQVVLGVVALTMELLGLQNSVALVTSTASHVVVGSLTLAASVVLAMQVQRYVRPVFAAAPAISGIDPAPTVD